jgi:hypothetical protein
MKLSAHLQKRLDIKMGALERRLEKSAQSMIMTFMMATTKEDRQCCDKDIWKVMRYAGI